VVSDTQQGVTGKMTAATVAAGLFANTALNVGNNAVLFPGTIGQFASNNETYLQINLQNLNGNGSSDFVATADVGTDTHYYLDVGMLGSTYDNTDANNSLGSSSHPLDGYIYVQGGTDNRGGNLIFGTTKTGKTIRFLVGGVENDNVFATLSETGFTLTQKPLVFADGTSQNTSMTWVGSVANNTVGVDATQNTHISSAWLQANTPSYTANSGATYANGAFAQANAVFTVANNTVGVDATQNTNISLAWTTANTALANTDGVQTAGSLTVTGAFYAANTIRTPLVFPNSQTAISLSFTGSSLVRANTAAGVTITPTNFVPGKFIDVYITNTDNSQHSITHGVAAINSSVGSTSFNLSSYRTAYLRYTSFDGDLANTYVTATYS
jgi:hypothetical protein